MAVLKSRKKLNNKTNWAKKILNRINEASTPTQVFRFNQKKNSNTKTFFKDVLLYGVDKA